MTDDEGPDEQPSGRVPGREPARRARPPGNGGDSETQLTAHVEPRSSRLEPGGSATFTLRVRNTGSVVDEIRFELLGEPARWGSVVPSSLRLFPGTQGEAVVTLQPPRASRPRAGTIELRIGISSQQRPGASIEESVRVEVAPFDEMTAALDPRFGATKGDFTSTVRVANRGNRPIATAITASDPHNALLLTVKPDRLHIEPETEGIARLNARPHRRIWFGHQRALPFDVVVDGSDAGRRTLDGRLDQLPLLPRWVPGLAAVALAIALAGGVACGAGVICAPGATATPTPFGQVTPTPGQATLTPATLTSPPGVTPTAPVTGAPDLANCRLTVRSPLAEMYSSTSVFSERVGPVPPGEYTPVATTVVPRPGGEERWFQVRVGQRTGWMPFDGFHIDSKSEQCP